jgi:GNAT superfamily N-acetyltransferase
MHGTAANDLEAVLLSLIDVDEIFALYELARSVTPYGFLANRSKNDYRRILHIPEDIIGLGIKDGDRLIAYSIWHRIAANPYPQNLVLSAIDVTAATVFHSGGSAVHPEYQGRGLGRRLFEIRLQQMKERRIDHCLGLSAVENLPSIRSVLRAGSLIVGFARDETALNYIVYTGHLRERLMSDVPPVTVSSMDHNQQDQLFAQRHAICGLSHPGVSEPASSQHGGGECQFRFLPVG